MGTPCRGLVFDAEIAIVRIAAQCHRLEGVRAGGSPRTCAGAGPSAPSLWPAGDRGAPRARRAFLRPRHDFVRPARSLSSLPWPCLAPHLVLRHAA